MNILDKMKLFDIDVWVSPKEDELKYCEIIHEFTSGILVVSANDINDETRQLLKKILAAFKFKARSCSEIPTKTNLLVIFGCEHRVQVLSSIDSIKKYTFPKLIQVASNQALKKRIWQDLNGYLQNLK